MGALQMEGKMSRLGKVKPLAWLTLVTLLPSCGSLVSWNYYAPFRLMGEERAVSPVDPAEVHHFGVASRLHYLSITVDAVYFRNLHKTLGRQVALGIDLQGAVDKQSIKTVSEPVSATGPQSMLFFERPFAVDPFLYRGLPLRLTLSFRDVGPSEAANLRGRLAALGLGVARKLVPGATERLKLHATQYEAFMGKDHKGKLFSYTFSLYPSDMEGVRQDLVVTGGRHVFIGIPSPSSPKFINKVKPADIAYKLRLEGRRLHWRHNGREYTDSPYIILSIIRYKRYPSDDTALRRAANSVDRFIEQENWQMARSNLGTIGSALLEERGITQMERNLEQAWKDYRAARIEHGEAKAKGEKEPQLVALLKQIKLLGYIGKDFQQILEPAEEKDLLFRAKRLARQSEELSRELGKPEGDAKKIADEAIASIKIVEPPPPPPGLKPPDVVKIIVAKPEPFYTRWWFYALLGVAGAGFASGLGYAVTRPNDPPPGVRFFVGKPAP
jgi:hypothetical protein